MSKLVRDDEEQLIARSQSGDVHAFNQLIERYQQIVYGTVFRLVGDYDTSADIAQDAFIAAFRSIHTYRGGSSFRAWLLRIASNMSYDHWRRVQRHPVESLDTLVEENEPHAPSLLNMLASNRLEDNPEDLLLTLELQDLIQRGLEQLPLDQRTAIVLCDIQGLSYEEIADAMQSNLGTVRSRISRGRSRLRNFLVSHRELLPRNYRPNKSNE